jgi:GTP pyrophosphokinase
MLFALTQDLRPIFITLAGHLDTLKFVGSLPKNEQIKKGVEALEIFSPLAYGLGMGEIKGQFEDLAFPILYPKEYNWLIKEVADEFAEREKDIKELKPFLKKVLTKNNIKILDIHARSKRYFSLYQKLLRYEMDVEKIHDLVALRVIVPDIETCYRALGIIHNIAKPLPGRVKDYIGSPKANGYRSLHTTILCPVHKKRHLEIQIKTLEMHKEADYGAAAHLSYKGNLLEKTYKKKFFWLDKVRQWRAEIKDTGKVSERLKSELFKDQVFVFTPDGDVINLTKGSTPIDFAYAVHSAVGDHCSGAKVNKKMVSLDYELNNGETIEILIDKRQSPSSDWLRIAKTTKALSKIRHFLESAYGMPLTKSGKKPLFEETIPLIKKILPLRKKKVQDVLIGGESGISIKLSHCCSPQKGDDISGFITKGEGASIHKTNCKNFRFLKEKWPQRVINAEWNNKEKDAKD